MDEPAVLCHGHKTVGPLELKAEWQIGLPRRRHLPPPGDRLHELRTIEVREHIATAEAREKLRNLANSAADASLSPNAQAALGRL
jgi:hypothetical protein